METTHDSGESTEPELIKLFMDITGSDERMARNAWMYICNKERSEPRQQDEGTADTLLSTKLTRQSEAEEDEEGI
jgi:hypothetical protein